MTGGVILLQAKTALRVLQGGCTKEPNLRDYSVSMFIKKSFKKLETKSTSREMETCSNSSDTVTGNGRCT